MLQKIVLLKNWNCFKIPRIWRNSHLFDMLFSQKFQWVLLLQDYFKIRKYDPMLMTQILLLTKKDASLCFWSCFWFSHALSHFIMFLLTYSTPRTRILSSTTHSPCFGAKSEIYYSSVTIYCYYSLSLFTCYYSLRIFAYLRGVVPYIWNKFWGCLVQDFFPRESYHLWAFLWEISLLITTSLHLYYLYKACNS